MRLASVCKRVTAFYVRVTQQNDQQSEDQKIYLCILSILFINMYNINDHNGISNKLLIGNSLEIEKEILYTSKCEV